MSTTPRGRAAPTRFALIRLLVTLAGPPPYGGDWSVHDLLPGGTPSHTGTGSSRSPEGVCAARCERAPLLTQFPPPPYSGPAAAATCLLWCGAGWLPDSGTGPPARLITTPPPLSPRGLTHTKSTKAQGRKRQDASTAVRSSNNSVVPPPSRLMSLAGEEHIS